jgi:hypothetical protein
VGLITRTSPSGTRYRFDPGLSDYSLVDDLLYQNGTVPGLLWFVRALSLRSLAAAVLVSAAAIAAMAVGAFGWVPEVRSGFARLVIAVSVGLVLALAPGVQRARRSPLLRRNTPA